MHISFTSTQHTLTEMRWTLWTITYTEDICKRLGKPKLGKREWKSASIRDIYNNFVHSLQLKAIQNIAFQLH
jgi:hypothetical protein